MRLLFVVVLTSIALGLSGCATDRTAETSVRYERTERIVKIHKSDERKTVDGLTENLVASQTVREMEKDGWQMKTPLIRETVDGQDSYILVFERATR